MSVLDELARLAGGVGAVVSCCVEVDVVTLKAPLAADTLPAASFAFTVKLYAVPGVKPVTV
ncbi:hypothetical protein D3C85_1696450 [compost metagenome]